jgi:hypothetical protein
MLVAMLSAISVVALWPRELPASIEDQRARLPAPAQPAQCADPVAGTWQAHVYYARLHDWYRYELRIVRVGNQLSGTIWLRGWNGTVQETEPPACRPGLRDAEWSEVASGVVQEDGKTLQFNAQSFRVEREHCGHAGGDYALDRFAGTIDPARQEFVSVNTYTFSNGETFSDPTLFRRTACPGPVETQRPTVVVVPSPEVRVAPQRRRMFSCSR